MTARTLGLSHVSLAVRDPERSLGFYSRAFGVREYFRDAAQIQVTGPGPHDVLAFERDPDRAGQPGGIGHFGFRLASPDDIDGAVADVLAAGGTLRRRGEFAPGLPYAVVADPDGYEIELWFEPAPAPRAEPASDPAPAAAPPMRYRPARLPTRVRAHRCLRRVPDYAPLPEAPAVPDDWLGERIGDYRNPDGVVVQVQADGVRWQGGAQVLYAPYDDIVDIESPGGETTAVLILVMANGMRLPLPVRGRHGRFCDSAAMLRFLQRVREDRAPRESP